MSALYSLRSDLEFSTQTQQGESFVVVKDPVANRYFRFRQAQATILELLRSPATIEQLEAVAAAELGSAPRRETLEGFLESLSSKHLLDSPTLRQEINEDSEPRRGESLLYLRLASFDAERVFDWLYPRAWVFFTPQFQLVAILAILTGLAITLLNADVLIGSVLSLLSVYGLFLIWLVGIGVVTLHELAHGLTCKHFGGRVRELGFMLIYFQPALYCDVSDSWMFPSRRQRMWVTFAGGYFQLVVWGAAAVIWRLTTPETLINQIALIAIIFSGLQTLFNFNPLIRLDGYYILSDYLEIPNLRAKARQALRAWLAGGEDTLLDSGDRGSLLVYGVLSLTFSTLLLSVVYVNIYVLATSYFAFAGFIGFVLFSGFTLRRAAAEPTAGAKALVTRVSRKKYLSLGIAALFLLVILFVRWPLRIAADFQVLAGEERIVRALTDGTIEEILVVEGKRVHHGQPIAYLYSFEREDEIGNLEGQLAAKESELALLEAGPSQEEIEEARSRIATKQQELENVRRNNQERVRLEQIFQTSQARVRLAEEHLRTTTQLFEEDLGPRNDMVEAGIGLEAARSEAATARAALDSLDEVTSREEDLKRRELEQAESELQLLLAGNRVEAIEETRAEYENLLARLMGHHQELVKNEIVAPLTGTVTTRFVERLVGQHVLRGDELMRIMELNAVTAELSVPEKEIADVQIGSEVTLKAHSYPDRDFLGQVSFISPIATDENGDRVVNVEVDLANEEGLLKPDVTGVAKVHADWRPIYKLMTRRMVRWLRTEFWDLLP